MRLWRRLAPSLYLLGVLGCAGAEPATNLLLITLDTTRVDALGVYGNPLGHTPTLDRLAQRAVVFDNALTPIGTTIPAHASLFTGLYPRHHRVRSNYDALDESFETLAEVLRANGYATAAWVGFQTMLASGGLGQGFDAQSRAGAQGAVRPGDAVNRSALEWLARPRDEPFFAWLHYFEPHAPYPLTPYAAEKLRDYSGPLANGAPVLTFYSLGLTIPWSDRERRAIRVLYDGEIRAADRLVGEVLEQLRATGLDEHTVVVVTSDHGQLLGENDRVGHAFSLDTPVVRVPLLIADPRIGGPRRIEARVGLVDLFPTLVERLGLDAAPPGDGRSLTAAIRGAPLETRTYFAEVQNQSQIELGFDTRAVAVYHDRFTSVQCDGRFSTFDDASDPAHRHALDESQLPGTLASIRRLSASYYDEVADAVHRDVPEELEAELRALGYTR